jgi:tetrahydromethanopterin S-methyltransferase subunit B
MPKTMQQEPASRRGGTSVNRCRAAEESVPGRVCIALVAWMLLSWGCRHAEQAGRSARGIIGTVEPTGVVAETEARMTTWEAIKQRLDELDIQGVNDAVAALTSVADLMRARLEALPAEHVASLGDETLASLSALRQQVEEADIGATTRSLRSLIDDLRSKTGAVPADEARALIREVTQLATELRATVQRIEGRLETVGQQTETLAQRATELVEAVSADQVRQVVERLDEATAEAKTALAPIRRAGERWPETTRSLDGALRSATFAVRVAMVAFGLWGLCAVAWLVRLMRPRGAQTENV